MLEVDVRHQLGGFTLDAAFASPGDGATVLFGPSGAGKSTVLSAVAGALRPSAGRVVVDGRVLFDSRERIDTPMEQRRIGWCAQQPRLFPTMPVRANLLYGARRAGRREARIGFDEAVAVLDLAPLLQRRVGALSGGEKQRVALGRALLSQPDLLLLDEPLSAVDGRRRGDALALLETLRDRFGVPMLYVTHGLDEALRLADHLVVLDAGRTVAQGAPAEALASCGAADAASAVARVVGPADGGAVTELRSNDLLFRIPALPAPAGADMALTIAARRLPPARRSSA